MTFCSTWGPAPALRLRLHCVDQIIDYCLGFRTFPERGSRHDKIATGLRTVGWRRRATIAFEIRDETVVILRILYAGRTLELPPDEDDAT